MQRRELGEENLMEGIISPYHRSPRREGTIEKKL
jgi:hypothetical protein